MRYISYATQATDTHTQAANALVNLLYSCSFPVAFLNWSVLRVADREAKTQRMKIASRRATGKFMISRAVEVRSSMAPTLLTISRALTLMKYTMLSAKICCSDTPHAFSLRTDDEHTRSKV